MINLHTCILWYSTHSNKSHKNNLLINNQFSDSIIRGKEGIHYFRNFSSPSWISTKEVKRSVWQMDFLNNGRGGFFLLHAGYKYSIRNKYNDRTYWRCVDRQCPATLTTCNIVVAFGRLHNHEDNHFTQLYTLHASVNGTVFPLVFGLLPNKSEATYNRFFGLLKDAIQDLQSVLNPEHWLLDFEVAAKNAVQRNFPGTFLKSCFFHFTKCIWRKD